MGEYEIRKTRDIRTAREREGEASQRPYPPRMDTPLWSHSVLFVLPPPVVHKTQIRGEDTTCIAGHICSILGSTELSELITGREPPEDDIDSSSMYMCVEGGCHPSILNSDLELDLATQLSQGPKPVLQVTSVTVAKRFARQSRLTLLVARFWAIHGHSGTTCLNSSILQNWLHM